MQPEWPIYEEMEEPLGDVRPPHVALVEQTPGSLGALTGAAVREAPGAVEFPARSPSASGALGSGARFHLSNGDGHPWRESHRSRV